jgi:electron transport complex protein RnfG
MSSVKRAGPIRLIATLGIAGLLSGLILVVAYLATQPIILRNQAKALEAAIYRVVPGSTTRKEFVVRDGKLIAEETKPGANQPDNVVYGAYDSSGKLLGYAIPGEGAGFQDTISLIYGYDPHDKKIIGLEILESRETPGLGDKIVKDPNFHKNFDDLSVEPQVVAVKHGTKSAPNEVDSISGATISSKAVVSIIDKENKRFLPVLNAAQGSEENPQ